MYIFNKNSNMKKIFLLIIAISFCFTTFSQNQWNQIHPYPTLKNLRDVHFNSEEEGWIIGNDATGSEIMYTNDAGVTWDTQLSGEGAPSSSLFFIDESEGWAGGWKCIWHTTDKGNTWESQSVPDVDYIIDDIFFINNNVGWAVGINNTIMKTTDGGLNWILITNSSSSVLRFSSVNFTDEMHGCAVGGFMYYDDGFIMLTNDGGDTWSDVSPSNCNGFTKVTFIDSLTGWVCGFSGGSGPYAELHNTTDGGLTWTKHIIDGGNWFRDIHFVNQDTGMILDENEKVLLTYDGGLSWDSTYYTDAFSMRKLSFWNNSGCYAVGYYGRIIKSTNLGQSWENIGQTIGWTDLKSIGFFDSFNGLALSYYNNLYRTEDGGYSWELDTLINNGKFYLLNINGSSGYLLNTNSQMMKTTNGGEDWALQDVPQTSYQYKDLQFVNENTGYLCGNYGVLKKTIDGGIIWKDKSLSSEYNLNDISFINEELGWLFDISGRTLLKTEDGGNSWSVNLQGDLLNMFFLDENIGFVKTVNPSGWLKTTDGGNLWERIYSFPPGDGQVYFINENVGTYIAGPYVFNTYDGGVTWQDEKIFDYTSINDIYFLDDNQCWIAGDAGFVGMCDFTVDIDEVKVRSSPISVFPNPVNDYVSIKQDYSQGKILDVKVFNVQGLKIMHFPYLSEPESFKFNISSLQSGAYFIEVTTEHNDQRVKLIVK